MHLTIWIIFGTALILSLVALPLWSGRVKPNRLYGFRTPRLVTDPRAWYPANVAMGKDLFFAGLAMAVGALVLGGLTPAGVEPAVGPLLAVILVPVFAAMLHGLYVASALVAELDGIAAPTGQAEAGGEAEAAKQRRRPQKQRQ